jgi:hypothetical protein
VAGAAVLFLMKIAFGSIKMLIFPRCAGGFMESAG